MSEYLWVLVWLAFFAFGILCTAKLFLSFFSEQMWKSVRKNFLLHILGLSLFLLPMLLLWLPSRWPPIWLTRQNQRRSVSAIVEVHGGWKAFRSEAAMLIDFAQTNQQYQWFPRRADPESSLPAGYPLLTSLKPLQVEVRPCDGQRQCYVVYVKVYGLHSTGGRGIPFYGLVYVPTNAEALEGPMGLERLTKKEIAPSVYELYR